VVLGSQIAVLTPNSRTTDSTIDKRYYEFAWAAPDRDLIIEEIC